MLLREGEGGRIPDQKTLPLKSLGGPDIMRMVDVRVGMQLRPSVSSHYPDVTVTELTADGFKYRHEPFLISPRIGVTEGGEHFGFNGEALYEPIERA